MGMSSGGGMKGRPSQPGQPQSFMPATLSQAQMSGLGSMIGGGSPGLPNTSQSGGFDPWAASRNMANMQGAAGQASQAAQLLPAMGRGSVFGGQGGASSGQQPQIMGIMHAPPPIGNLAQGGNPPAYNTPNQAVAMPAPMQPAMNPHGGLAGGGLGPNYASPAVANTMPAMQPKAPIMQAATLPQAVTPQAQQMATALRASSKFGY